MRTPPARVAKEIGIRGKESARSRKIAIARIGVLAGENGNGKKEGSTTFPRRFLERGTRGRSINCLAEDLEHPLQHPNVSDAESFEPARVSLVFRSRVATHTVQPASHLWFRFLAGVISGSALSFCLSAPGKPGHCAVSRGYRATREPCDSLASGRVTQSSRCVTWRGRQKRRKGKDRCNVS